MSAISKALTWLISNIIAPVCSFIWENAVKYVVEYIGEILATLIYKVYALLLSILYGVETAIYSFAGATDVKYQGKSTNILTLIFELPAVSKAFWYITGLGVILLFIFTIITVMKMTVDFGYDGKKNVGTILTSFITSAITFLVMPAFCYGLIELTSRCMNALYIATSTSGTASLTDNLFMLSVRSNLSNEDYSGLVTAMSGQKMFWYNLQNVLPYIHKAVNVDFVVGTIGIILLLINLLAMGGVFIQRVIEIIVLYIVSPFFVATMPLDDGERFGRWRRTFIGRLCMGVGMIVSLNIVMMVIGIVVSGSESNSISFTQQVDANSDVVRAAANKSVDIILKLIFVIGSILSVKNFGTTITGIIDQEAAMSEGAGYREGINRLFNAPKAVAGVIGAGENIAKKVSDYQKSGYENKMKSVGMTGEVANLNEKNFVNSIESKNSKNAFKAAMTKRGGKYSAINFKIKEGKDTLDKFKSLKNHDEREKFMADFKKKGGVDSLGVEGSKFGSSEITSIGERHSLSNIDSRISMTKKNRDSFAKGSEGWKKYDSQLSKLNNTKEQFNMLNTHKERDAFIKSHSEFNDVPKFNASEAKGYAKLSISAFNAKRKMDNLPKGSTEWKKASDNYEKLMYRKAEFDTATTHNERSQIMAKFSEVDNTVDGKPPLNKAEEAFAKNVQGLMDKSNRKLSWASRGTAKLAYKANALAAKGIIDGFNACKDHKARADFMKKVNSEGQLEKIDSSSIKNDAEWSTVVQNKAGNLLDNKLKTAIENRDKFEKDSDGWKYFNNEATNLAGLAEQYDGLGTRGERDAFIASNLGVFGQGESINSANRKQLSNINKNIQRAENVRKHTPEGSEARKAADNQLLQLMQAKTVFEGLASTTARNSFVEGNSDMFADNTSSKDTTAYNNIRNKRIIALSNRDMFEEGSQGWNMYDSQINALDKLSNQMETIPLKAEREAFIDENSDAFGEREKMSFENDKQMKALNRNIRRVEAQRNMHKVGSGNWNKLNNELDGLKMVKAKYSSISSQKDRNDFASSKKVEFTDAMANDKNFAGIENSKTYWSALEQYSNDPTTKEHAHKMAKVYEIYAERYSRADSDEEKDNIVKEMSEFEVGSANTPGLGLTPKENASLPSMVATGNEKLIKDFIDAPSHSERKNIINSMVTQSYGRYDMLSTNESDYSKQFDEATSIYENMAKHEPDEKKRDKYISMGNTCRRAKAIFDAQTTHNQRAIYAQQSFEKLAEMSGDEINSLPIPQMAPPDLTQEEKNFVKKLDLATSNQIEQASSHRERYKIMDDYFLNSSNRVEFTQEEANTYNDIFSNNNDNEYENTAKYRTAFLAADSHEERSNIINEYQNYKDHAHSSEMPNVWNKTVTNTGISETPNNDPNADVKFYETNDVNASKEVVNNSEAMEADIVVERTSIPPQSSNGERPPRAGVGDTPRNVPRATGRYYDTSDIDARRKAVESIKKQALKGSNDGAGSKSGTSKKQETSKDMFNNKNNKGGQK